RQGEGEHRGRVNSRDRRNRNMRALFRTAVVLAFVAAGLAVAGPAFAVTSTFHDTQTVAGTTLDVTYTLSYPTLPNGTGTLTITTTNPGGTDIFAGDIIFKLASSGQTTTLVSGLTNWANTPPVVDIIGGGGSSQDGFTGFYADFVKTTSPS